MAEIVGKTRESQQFVKSGFERGLQRYKGKACGCQFTATDGEVFLPL